MSKKVIIGLFVVGVLALILATPREKAATGPSSPAREEPQVEADQREAAAESDEEREARQARAREHLENAYAYWAGDQLGLALVEAEQAVAADPESGEAQTVLRTVREARAAAIAAAREAEAAATATARRDTATATAAARREAAVAAQRQRAAAATVLDVRRLVSDPKAYVGQDIVVQGKALTVTHHASYTWVQVLAAAPGRAATTESVVVEFRPRQPDILRDECYRMWGQVKGTQTVTRVLTGARNEVPVLDGFQYQSAPARTLGGQIIGCDAP